MSASYSVTHVVVVRAAVYISLCNKYLKDLHATGQKGLNPLSVLFYSNK